MALWLSAGPVFAQEPTDNPVAAFYAGPEGWPAWTAEIRWTNVFNITNYGGGTAQSGAQNFAAFEAARDAAFAAGGGVVYFSAGTYDIQLPDAGQGAGVGPASRGLMLRSGVVLRGAAPVGDQSARARAAYPADGELTLPTRLRFAKRTRNDEDGVPRTIPCDWSLIGLKPEAGQGVKDVHRVGVVWLEVEGATIFWGAQYPWASNWNASTAYLGGRTKDTWPVGNPWSNRVADGTHPGDSFCGVASPVTYAGAGRGRLVFGVKLTDAAVVNDFYWPATRGVNAKTNAFAPYRFCGRVSAYGSDVFVANNVLPLSSNNFIYRQWTKNAANIIATRDVLWDYANTIGLDVNKSLNGLAKPTPAGAGYYEENVVVRDNWIFNRGNKGCDVSGQYAVLQNNHNERYYVGYISPPAPYPNPGEVITAMLDGYNVQTLSDGEKAGDFLSRGYDLGARNLWADHCTVANTGSVGNDGEGVMSQRLNNIDVYSWAYTDCRQYVTNLGAGTSGETGWIGCYGQNIYGLLLLRNINDGWIGHGGATNNTWWMLDVSAAVNLRNNGTAATLTLNHSGALLPKDAQTNAPVAPVTAPASLTATPLGDLRGIQLNWTDHATNETGFRIERRIQAGPWQVIAYRPMLNASKTNSETEAFSATPISQINNSAWLDFLAPRGLPLEYRVFAINANDDGSYGSALAGPVFLGVALTPPNLTFAVVGTNLHLSWPATHIGWALQHQTNALTVGPEGNWMAVPGAATTNQVVVPVNLTTPTAFYRLRYSL